MSPILCLRTDLVRKSRVAGLGRSHVLVKSVENVVKLTVCAYAALWGRKLRGCCYL